MNDAKTSVGAGWSSCSGHLYQVVILVGLPLTFYKCWIVLVFCEVSNIVSNFVSALLILENPEKANENYSYT